LTFSTEITNQKIFDALFSAAQDAETIQCSRHASAIVYKRQILAIGRNSRKSHPMQARFGGENKICLHSEIDGIVRVINQHGADILKRCDLYNLRITKSGKIGLAKPCESCYKAVSAFGIKKVFWT